MLEHHYAGRYPGNVSGLRAVNPGGIGSLTYGCIMRPIITLSTYLPLTRVHLQVTEILPGKTINVNSRKTTWKQLERIRVKRLLREGQVMTVFLYYPMLGLGSKASGLGFGV